MQRWNGWGHTYNDHPLKTEAHKFLQQQIGMGKPLADVSLDSVAKTVPKSRLRPHPLISFEPELRLRHARGHSLPDWLAKHSGDLGTFPDGVALPDSNHQVRELLHYARENHVEIIPYGGGTSVAGHINPQAGARPVLTVSMANFNRLLDIDPVSQLATLGAGTPGPLIESQLRLHGYMLGHYPQSWEFSTLGGWVASRSSGQQSLRYGRIEQLFAGARVETIEGTLNIPTIPASAAGPDIREMILGSEGRLGIITEVSVRISALPRYERFYGFFLPDWQCAIDCIRELAQQRIPLSMMRLSNPMETWTQLKLAGNAALISTLERYLRLRGARDNKCMLILGVTGDREGCESALNQSSKIIRRHSGIGTGALLGNKWRENRFRSPYLRQSLWQLGYAVDTVETAVNWNSVTTTMKAMEHDIRSSLQSAGGQVHVFSHLSHIYHQGSSIYTTFVFPCGSSYQATLEHWQQMKAAASRAIVANGGTISHQHGVGSDHAPYLKAEKGELGIAAIQSLCQRFDPLGIMNPGKLLPQEQAHDQVG